jgi:hypothetical protein
VLGKKERTPQEQERYEQLLQNAYRDFPEAKAYPEIMQNCADHETRTQVTVEQVLQALHLELLKRAVREEKERGRRV